MSAGAVGPVLDAGEVGDAVIAAIRSLNPTVTVEDRGAYRRVLVPERCVVTREAIEVALGRPFQLPGDLELVMPSFTGVFKVTEERAEWGLR